MPLSSQEVYGRKAWETEKGPEIRMRKPSNAWNPVTRHQMPAYDNLETKYEQLNTANVQVMMLEDGGAGSTAQTQLTRIQLLDEIFPILTLTALSDARELVH